MTTHEIEAMRDEAGAAGDMAMVAICDRALSGDEKAIVICERVASDAAAMAA